MTFLANHLFTSPGRFSASVLLAFGLAEMFMGVML